MNPYKKFQEFINSVQSGDTEGMKEIINSITDDRHTTIIKCESCGEIISFEKTRDLFMVSAGKVPPAFNYRMLKHMMEDPDHNIIIPLQMGVQFNLSQIVEGRFRSHCKRGDNGVEVDYDTWFPTYVERWRIKAGM